MSSLCRLCKSPLSHTFVDLGVSPLANSFIARNRANAGEIFYPLHAYVCDNCFLVQLEEFEKPDAIFSNYVYFSSFSAGWLRHADAFAETMKKRFGLGPESKVVEVASNDGYLLQYFASRGVPVLGVEPAANVAETAIAKGIPTHVAFFGTETAAELRAAGHSADLIAANNVLAHVPDIIDFVSGFKILLKESGAATFEFPHLLRMIQQQQFDTIYHEHFSYLSLGVVADVMRRCGLRVFDVEELATHGGSLRVFVCHDAADFEISPNVAHVLALERDARLNERAGYAGFADAAARIKASALEFLIAAKREGKTVCGYGAAAKGNTFLNYLGVGPDFVALVADRSPHKQGTLLPGSRIPVASPEEMLALRPDYILILAWNLKEEIVTELAAARAWGCRFVVAVPNLSIM